MNLLVDLGNTYLKWALSGGDRRQVGGSLAHGVRLGDQLNVAWKDMPQPEKAVIASVASSTALQALTQWITEHWPITPHIVTPGRELLGVRNLYSHPESLGSDRWAALIAARHLVSAPVCVVDCGTAVTMDALSGEGDYLGGVVFPGLGLLRKSLADVSGALAVPPGNTQSCQARSTADGIAAGTFFGLAGAVERVLAEFRRELGPAMQVLLTGGDAPLLAPKLDCAATEEPDLVLKGLGLIAEQLP